MLIEALIYSGQWGTKQWVFWDKSLMLYLQNCWEKNGCQGYAIMAVGLERKEPMELQREREFVESFHIQLLFTRLLEDWQAPKDSVKLFRSKVLRVHWCDLRENPFQSLRCETTVEQTLHGGSFKSALYNLTGLWGLSISIPNNNSIRRERN